MHLALGLAAGAERLELSETMPAQNTFGKDAPCRVAGAEKEHVVDVIGHECSPTLSVAYVACRQEITAKLGMALTAVLGQVAQQTACPLDLERIVNPPLDPP